MSISQTFFKHLQLLCLFYFIFSCNREEKGSGCVAPTSGNGGGKKYPVTYNSINTIAIDGSNELQLIEERTASYSSLQFTPDGSKIIYEGYYSNSGIWIIDVNGSNKKFLIENGQQPHLSPDGTKVLFQKTRNDSTNLWIMNVDGTGATQITHEYWCINPRFSPDGKKIAYVTNSNIWITDSNGNNSTQLTDCNLYYYWQLNFSPDGSKLVFCGCVMDQPDDIYIISTSGGNLLNLTDNEFLDISPQFSPDGNKIVYVSEQDSSNIFIMNSDGSNKVNLTQSPKRTYFGYPIFSTDGSKIAFIGWGGLNIFDEDGTNLVFLSEADDCEVNFSPDGMTIVFVKSRKS